MRAFIIETAVPVVGYFVAVALCIGLVIFTSAVAIDLVSNPVDWSDAQ